MLTASVDVKLVSNGSHGKNGENGIYLKHEKKEFSNACDNEIIVTAGQVSIQCVVEGENTGQNIYFFLDW